MANVVIVGAQWGDEGKGKIVDWLCDRADMVVRFQGGHNAGHTLVVGDKVYKLSLLPSGLVQGKLSLIGNGVVVDPYALLAEIERISAQGVTINTDNLGLAENATLILKIHQDLDKAREEQAGKSKIGTTGRGIGPAYEDKVGRRALRVADLSCAETLKLKIERLRAHHDILRAGLNLPPIDSEELLSELLALAPKILPFVSPVWRILEDARKENKRVLFEGAQGILLDVDHGTYPYVTSSSTVAGQAASGTGTGPNNLDYVLGIVKAYTTRVGEGPFPTELFDDVGKGLGERGHEFGTVTGRARRCGWFDATLVHQTCCVGGITGLALTKLDVLDGVEELKICIGYKIGDKTYDYLPANQIDQKNAVPIYETMPGWTETTFGARSWKDLPANAIKYVRRIEELVGRPVALLSTSPERDDTILVKDPFEK